MCGRYAQTKGRKKLEALFAAVAFAQDLDFSPGYNIAPTQNALVVVSENGRVFKRMFWGLIPSWAKDETIASQLINARAETVAEKPSFRTALQRSRCLVVADSFYEWDQRTKPKQPMRFHLKSEEPFAFAGLCEHWTAPGGQERETFTIITTAANGLVSPYHDRMPVILTPDSFGQWLDETAAPTDLLRLLKPLPADQMTCYPVNVAVGRVANDSPACFEKLEPAQRSLF
jgi:putative SOS response-associated peptidase YedK